MHNGTILLVEDNDDDAKLTMRALKRNDVQNRVVLAADGVEALDFLRGQLDPPVLILLDLKLPKVDGLEVLQHIRSDRRTSRAPVVVLTSSVEDRDLERAYMLGANSYIRKPVDFSEFVEVAKSIGVYWLQFNQPPPTRP
jgi:two-component system, response regulator